MLDIERAGNCVRRCALQTDLRGPARPGASKTSVVPRENARAKVLSLGIDGAGLLTGEGRDVVFVIIRHSRVGPDYGMFMFSFIQWVRSSPGVGGSVYESR